MKHIRHLLAAIALFAFCVAPPAHAYPQITAQQLATMSPLDPAAVPHLGTFWLWRGPNGAAQRMAPLPCPPGDMPGVPIYDLGQGQFLVDDSQVDYNALAEQARVERALNGPLTPQENDPVTFPAGTLHLQVLSVSNNIWVSVCGLTNGTSGEILSREALDSGEWLSEGSLVSTNDEFNLVMLTMNTRTNSLFLTCRSPTDSSALPLWWQLKYFAATAVPGTNDFDGDCVNNLAEYLAGSDPNKIAFEAVFQHDHISGDNVSGTIELFSGAPAEMAILVNSTNFASAAWAPYSPNFSTNLPSVDGGYPVLVGLRGFAGADSLQTWRGATIWRDTQAPLLFLTNPLTSTGSRPLIQIKGYSPEPITLTWAATNALGAVAQGKGLPVDQLYSTNALDLGTNFFECLDIRLAPGTNYLGLSATDRAGNLTQTNLVYVFDTNGDTVAPVLSVTWPSDGSKLSADTDTFTLFGTLDDETATVVGQIVAPDGTTNTATTLVERNGRFWVQDLPMAAGTNVLIVTATDAAGNLSTTNLFVVKSDLSLAIAAPDAGQLYRPTATVTGIVAGPTNLVWVNGIQAQVDSGNGSWIATNVPVTPGGVAVFTATAYPPDEAPPSGEGAAYTPMTPNSCDRTLVQEKPPRVYIQRYNQRYSSQVGDYTWLWLEPVVETFSWGWAENEGASIEDTVVQARGYPSDRRYGAGLVQWPPDVYPPTLWGDIIVLTNLFTTRQPSCPPFEHCQLQGTASFYNSDDGRTESVAYSRSADSVVRVFAGGAEGIEDQRLHRLSVDLFRRAFQWSFGGVSWSNVCNIAPGASAGVFDPVGPDGNTYQVLASGKDVVATPVQPGVQYQGGDLPTDTAFKLRISFGGHDVTDTNTPVIAGQKISLSCTLEPQGSTPPPITNYEWTIPTYAVSNFVANVNTGQVFEVFAKTNANCDFSWVDGGKKEVKCTVKTIGKQLSAKAVFTVQRPNVQMTVQAPGTIAADTNFLYNFKANTSYTFLHFGGALQGTNVVHGMKFEIQGTDVDGEAFFIQTGTASETDSATNGTNYVATGRGVDNGIDPNDYIYPMDGSFQGFVATDSPATSLSASFTNVTMSDSFTMYLMFRPAAPGSIPVPINQTAWSWSGTAVLTNSALNLWKLTSAVPPSNPAPVPTTSYPAWTNHIIPFKWTPPLPQ